MSLQIYIIVVRKKNLRIFKQKIRFSAGTIHNGYCVSNAVDYAKKNDVLLTISSGSVKIDFSTEHNLTSIYH